MLTLTKEDIEAIADAVIQKQIEAGLIKASAPVRYSVKEAAELLGISQPSVRNYMADGLFGEIEQVGRLKFIPAEGIEQFRANSRSEYRPNHPTYKTRTKRKKTEPAKPLKL